MNIAIVEDSSRDAERLIDFLHRFENEEGTSFATHHYKDAESFLSAAEEEKFDLVLMDIEIAGGGMDGLAASSKWREIDPKSPLIFVTNMAQFAIKGYEVNALDFVVKPIDYQPFKSKIQKALRLIGNDASSKVIKAVNSKKESIMLKLSEIIYIESDGHFVILNNGKEEYRVHMSLKDAEVEYGKYGFKRVSGSFLANMAFVREIRKDTVLVGTTVLLLSRSKKKDFVDAFTVYLGEHA